MDEKNWNEPATANSSNSSSSSRTPRFWGAVSSLVDSFGVVGFSVGLDEEAEEDMMN